MGAYGLPALHVNPPQEGPGPLEQYGQVARLRALMGQQQLQQAQIQAANTTNQEAQLDLQSRQAFMKAYTEAQGDPDKTMKLAAQYGADPQSTIQMKNLFLEQQTKALQYFTAHGDAAKRDADLMQGAHDTVTAAKPEDRPAIYQQQLQALSKELTDPSQLGQMPQQYPGDDAFKFIGAMVKSHTQQMDELAKQSETFKNQQQGEEAGANKAKTQTEMEYYKSHGGAPGVPAETVQMNSWLENNPSKTPADFMKYKSTLVPQFNFNLQGAALNDQAKDMAAENYFQTGQLPAGARSPAIISQIINRAAQLHPGGNLAGNKAAYDANKASYDNVTKTLDTLSAFENAGLKNLKQFTDLAAKLPDTGLPWLNTPVRNLNKNMVGDQWMPAIEAARSVALREIARVTNDPKLSGTLTDSARQEVEAFSPANATLPQIKHVVDVLRNDMANVHQGLAQQKQDIGKRLGMGQNSETPQSGNAVEHTAGGTSNGLKDGTTGTGSDGQKYVVKNGTWVKQ